MKRHLFWILAIALLFPQNSALGQIPSLTLFEAIKIAKEENPDLAVAKERLASAEALTQKAKSSFWPHLFLYTEVLRADAPSVALFKTIDQRLFQSGTDFNTPGVIENIEAGAAMHFQLYNGGRNALTLQSARERVSAIRASQVTLSQNLTQQVIEAWYDTLSSQRFIAIARESVKTVQSQLQTMKVRYQGGSVLKSDLLSLNVRLAEAEEQLLASQNRLKLSRAALFTLMGKEPDAPIAINQDTPLAAWKPPPYLQGVEAALARRSEVAQSRAWLRQASHQIKIAQSGHLPTIRLSTQLYTDDEGLKHNANRANWSVGLRMDLPLFSGFSVQAQTEEAFARKQELKSLLKKKLLTIRLEVKNAYLRYNEAIKRHEVVQKAVAMAEESLMLVKRQYQGGSATITRYLEAELARNRARIRETAAYFEMQKALAAIARATASKNQGIGSLFAPPFNGRKTP
ncbi:MAG: TolC family protein [Desulfobacterales bacterium]|nr:TolC family protein [Desulfobacterales bacterium]